MTVVNGTQREPTTPHEAAENESDTAQRVMGDAGLGGLAVGASLSAVALAVQRP